MIDWIESNPLGRSLAIVCAALILLSGALAVIGMLPPSSNLAESDDEEGIASLDLPELRDIGDIEQFAEINNRPVFNESRQPQLDVDADENLEDELALGDVDAPDVELAGVIITPTLRMVTLREKGQERSLVAFEGRPLEGNYGSWQVSKIEPREVTMSSADGEEVQIPLLVHDAKIAAPPKAPAPAEKAAQGKTDGNGESGDQPLSRAEEIRQRIAERREELKQAAESGEQDTEQSYTQAIQSLMGKKSQDNTENDQKK